MLTRAKFATLLGRNSKKFWAAVTNAVWSFPARYLSFPLMVSASGITDVAAGDTVGLVVAISKGAIVGVCLRFVENLIHNFVVFGWVQRIFGVKK